MIIDKKGKLFGKVNIVDLCVLLVIVIGIVGVVFTKTKLDDEKILANQEEMLIKSSAELDKLEVKLELKEVRDVTRDGIVIGDEVYLASNDKVIGTVARVESEPSSHYVVADDGTVYDAQIPDRYDVTIVMETEGKKKGNGYYTDSNAQFLYGKEFEFKTSTIQGVTIVREITVVE